MKMHVIKMLTIALAVSGWSIGLQPVLAQQATDSNQSGSGIGTNSTQSMPAQGSGADSTQTGMDKETSSNGNVQSPVSGTVQAVDSTQKQLQVRDAQGNSTNLDIPSTASIMNGTKKGRLSDIKTGDAVTVTYGKNGKVMKVEKQKSDTSSPGANSGAPTNSGSTY